MENKPIHVLLLEDDPSDVLLIRTKLTKATGVIFEIESVDRLGTTLERLPLGGIDIILMDLGLPDSVGLEAFEKLHVQAPHIPIVILTGTYEGELLALDAIRKGAQDYLLKDDIKSTLLSRVLLYAIERKRSEEMRAQNKELVALVALKNQFVTSVSNELRTPLTVMREGISLLLGTEIGSLNKKQHEFLRVLQKNAVRLTGMINDLLDFSKIDAGHLPLFRRKTSVCTLIEQALANYKIIAGSRTVTASIPPVPDVFVDPNRVLQVLGNLLANAVKSTKDDGHITVAVALRNEFVAISVQDDGVGIHAQDIPKLFQKFSQIGPTEARTGGTGLGLALCKELLGLHTGKISVNSFPAQGSTFTFTLPMYTQELALEGSFRDLVVLAEHSEQNSVAFISVDCQPFLQKMEGDHEKILEDLKKLVGDYVNMDDTVLSYLPRWILIMCVTDSKGASAMLHRLGGLLREEANKVFQKTLRVDFHFGVAMYPTHGTDPHTLFAKATGSNLLEV